MVAMTCELDSPGAREGRPGHVRVAGLLPAGNVLDAEQWRFLPPGVSLHLTRVAAASDACPPKEGTAEDVDAGLEGAARLLAAVRPASVAYLCASSSFCGAPGHDRRIIRRLEEITSAPATTAATALVEAARALRLHRLVAISPHPAAVTRQLVHFLERNDFDVVGWHSMDLESDLAFQRVSSAAVYRFVCEADCTHADGIVIGCTALPTIDILDAMEREIGKPVLSASQATWWHALQLAGVQGPMGSPGRLCQLTHALRGGSSHHA